MKNNKTLKLLFVTDNQMIQFIYCNAYQIVSAYQTEEEEE